MSFFKKFVIYRFTDFKNLCLELSLLLVKNRFKTSEWWSVIISSKSFWSRLILSSDIAFHAARTHASTYTNFLVSAKTKVSFFCFSYWSLSRWKHEYFNMCWRFEFFLCVKFDHNGLVHFLFRYYEFFFFYSVSSFYL